MTKLDPATLRTLAEAATPGPWRLSASRTGVVAAVDDWWVCSVNRITPVRDVEYIAAASPDVVLALLDRLAQLEADRNEWRAAAASQARVHLECRDLERKLESSLDTSERVDGELQAARDRISALEAGLLEASDLAAMLYVDHTLNPLPELARLRALATSKEGG